MHLTKGIYGLYPEISKLGVFGLRTGQKRSGHLIGVFGLCTGQKRSGHVISEGFSSFGGWYNGRGEKLGWGDISNDDLKRIYEEISEDEIFIVMTLDAISLQDCAKNAKYIISRNLVSYVIDDDDDYWKKNETFIDRDSGMQYQYLDMNGARELIMRYNH